MSLIDLAAWGYAVYSLFATDQIRVDREKLVYTRRVLIPIRRRQVLLTRIANVDLRTIPTGKRTQTIIRIDADDGGLSFGIGVDPEELARWAQPLRERVMAAARHTMPAPLHKPNGELSATASEGGAKIPIELLVPPPRKVRLRPGRRAAVISILILAILIDLPGIGILLYAAIDPFFIRYTQPRPATIVDLRIVHGHRDRYYRVEYSYVFDGQQRIENEDVNYKLYHSLEQGQTVEVCAVCFGPFHYAEMRNGGSVVWRLGFAALGFAWNGGFYYLLVPILEPRRLARMGTPTVGRIRSKHISVRSSTSYCLKYTFRTAEGWKLEELDYVPRRVYERVSGGDEVIVVYKIKSDGTFLSDIYDFSDYEAK